MGHHTRLCRVVGIRPGGEQVLICEHASGEAAERVVDLLQYKSGFEKLLIEWETDDPLFPGRTRPSEGAPVADRE